MSPMTRLDSAQPRASWISLAIAALLSAAPMAAQALTTYTWKGGEWNDASTWAERAAPPTEGLTRSALVFGSSSVLVPKVLPPGYSVYSLTFSTGASAYTFTQSALTLGEGGLTQNAAHAQTFQNRVILGANQTWNLASGAGALNFAGGLNTTGGPGGSDRALMINAASTTGSGNTLSGIFSGGGSLTKTGAGILTLTGASTYTGYTTVSDGTLAIGSGAGIQGGDLWVGNAATLALSGTSRVASSGYLVLDGTVNLSGSSSLSVHTALIGNNSSGTVNQSGGSFSTNGGDLYVGAAFMGNGTFNQGGGSVTTNGGSLTVGSEVRGKGTFNQSGGSVTTEGGTFTIGKTSGNGSYTLSGSASSLSTGAAYIGYLGSGSSGTFNQTGGSFTTNGNTLILGYGDATTGTYTLSGDTSTLSTATLSIGGSGSGSGTFNQNGGTVSTGGLYLGYGAGAQATYNLNGGMLAVGQIGGGGTGGGAVLGATATFNFNGGTLQASADSTNFFTSAPSTSVQEGGAKIDTNGHNVTVAASLRHGGQQATDGGLTKLGAGTLTLTGSNSFTGGLNIVSGTLAVASESNLGSGSIVDVSGRGTLLFNRSTTLARTYQLGLATLSVGSGNTLTLGNGAAINNGLLAGAGTFALGNGALLDGTRASSTSISQSAGTATFNNVLLTGTSKFTQAAGATLNTTGDFTANAQTTLVVNGGINMRQGGSVSGGLTINRGVVTVSGGAGTALYLDGSRGTTVNTNGQISAASGSTLELGGLLVNNGTQSGVLNVNLGGVAKGSGVFGTVNVGEGGTFSPGNSPGTATATNVSFASGGSYQFELNTASPSYGINADLLVVTDTLALTAGTTADSVFTIDIDSLNLANQSAALSDFNSSLNYHWLLVDANTVTGFDSAKFYVDTRSFSNSLNGGSFSVSLSGNDLYLDFTAASVTAVPEPESWAMLLAGAALLGGLRARQRRMAIAAPTAHTPV